MGKQRGSKGKDEDVKKLGGDKGTFLFPYKEYHEPKFREKLLEAVETHRNSYNTFSNYYVTQMASTLDPIYIDPFGGSHNNINPHYKPEAYASFRVVDVEVLKPVRGDKKRGMKETPCMERMKEEVTASDLRHCTPLLPQFCRQAHTTYNTPLYVTFQMTSWKRNAEGEMEATNTWTSRQFCGAIPVMVNSDTCWLSTLTPEEKMRVAFEDPSEPGGYFIINGNERVIRLVVSQRCNYPIAVRKESFKLRDMFFTEYAVLMRSQRTDGTSTNNILFFTEDYQCSYRVLLNRQEHTAPFWIVLRALMPDLPVEMIRQKLLSFCVHDPQLLSEMNQLISRFIEDDELLTGTDASENRYLHKLGKSFELGLRGKCPPGATYADMGQWLLKRCVLVHCDDFHAKFECCLIMFRKLWAVKHGHIPPENVDSFAYQELNLPGQLIASVLKDSLYNFLQRCRASYQVTMNMQAKDGVNPLLILQSEQHFQDTIQRNKREISHAVNYFLATGNVNTFQLDLQQLVGWTVVADRINWNRFLSHYRAVHRGQAFAKMRTTEVRKLMGETWGFLCPVHTPDGGPCGLLLHMTRSAVPVCAPPTADLLNGTIELLRDHGKHISKEYIAPPSTTKSYPLMVDGRFVCDIPMADFTYWVDKFRDVKRKSLYKFNPYVEVAAFEEDCGAFPGIFLFSYPGRLVRPVRHLKTNQIEYVGPLAQPWMNIAAIPEEVVEAEHQMELQQHFVDQFSNRNPKTPTPSCVPFENIISAYRNQLKKEQIVRLAKSKVGDKSLAAGVDVTSKNLDIAEKVLQQVPIKYTHVESNITNFTSVTSSMTPFSNHNQSPRNMYQCQMLKQTMGTPFFTVPYRHDNKAYRLNFPQIPIIRTADYRTYEWDEYPTGTNAVVAVAAYTGMDMEDAMIVNKGAFERQAFSAVVYKQKIVDAAPQDCQRFDVLKYVFSNAGFDGKPIVEGLDADGFPPIGQYIQKGDPIYRTVNKDDPKDDGHVVKYKEDEPMYMDKVSLIHPPDQREDPLFRSGVMGYRASLKYRVVRDPCVGDKFASRAGQKGIMSMFFKHEDMPFSSTGVVPDILFNPHGFPSRMTVGMLIESMGGKAACLEGVYNDCSPFGKFKREDYKDKWIDQNGYHGYCKRGGRYLTKTEKEIRSDVDTGPDYYGKKLLSRGFQYYGTEQLHSGIFGNEMPCHIFIGIIFYQRLRHMVSDKWQCRSTGAYDKLTHQPVKGRKRGGGVRFGEMERDSLLAHGTSSLLQDRLLRCSDQHKAHVCPSCGSILTPQVDVRRKAGGSEVATCRLCETQCRLVQLPYVFRYISNELSAMNVIIKLDLLEADQGFEKEAGG